MNLFSFVYKSSNPKAKTINCILVNYFGIKIYKYVSIFNLCFKKYVHLENNLPKF